MGKIYVRKIVYLEKIIFSIKEKLYFLIIIIALQFYSCNYFYKVTYQKCDYCNIDYKSEKIFVETNYENSYHKKCNETYLDKNNTKKYIKNKKQTKVGKKTDITTYFKEVQSQMEKIGLNVRSDVNIKILNKNELVKECNSYFYVGCAVSPNNIYILDGFLESEFKGILAHEMTHIWQYQNNMGRWLTKINKEGLAELVQAHILKMDSTNYFNKVPNFYHRSNGKIISKRNKPYVLGYQKLKNYLDYYGWEKLIQGYSMYF